MLKLVGKAIGAGAHHADVPGAVAGAGDGSGGAVSFLLASCAPAGPAGGAGTAASGSGVITLNKISTLKSLFNRDDGHTRLILIFSPT